MASKNHIPRPQTDVATMPFDDVEECWFWFIQAQAARVDGARFSVGQGLIPRPCEPMDILRVLDRLWRTRRLHRDHLMVLRHYGRRMLPPDARRPKEMHAAVIWEEALDRLAPVLISKGIVRGDPTLAERTLAMEKEMQIEMDMEWEAAE